MDIHQYTSKKACTLTRRRFAQLTVLGGAFLVTSCTGITFNHPLNHPLDGSFLQLWQKDAARSDADWEKRLQKIYALKCRDIILQWVAYGDAFSLSPATLHRMLDFVAESGMRLTFGLPYDPGYWAMLTRGRAARTDFLKKSCRSGPAVYRKMAIHRPPGVCRFLLSV